MEWERENSEKYDGPNKSYMPESRSWPKYERKEYRQNEQNQHIRKPHQIIFPENNYCPQSNQSSKNVKDVEIGIDMSPSLQLRSISRAADDSNPYMVNDGAVRSPSTLTFRPWGGSNKSKEGEERIPFSPQINQSSLDAHIPKGKQIIFNFKANVVKGSVYSIVC